MAAIFHYREPLSQLGSVAYPGVMLEEVGNSAMILPPTPWPTYAREMSVILNPLLVGLFGGLAAAGELVGYYLGCKGRTIVSEGHMYVRMKAMTAKYGDRVIFFGPVAAAKIVRITIVSAATHYGITLMISRVV